MLNTPVTVSITNYNGAKYLPWCLESINNLTIKPAEIIVVDNASTDESVKLLKENYPQLKLICLDRNEGPAPARNRGVQEAKSPLVFQIDCDIAPKEDSLALLLKAMEEGNEDLIICQPRAVFDNEPDRIHYDGGFFHYVGLMNLINFYQKIPRDEAKPREVDAIISMALLIKKEPFLRAGGYDPSFFILFEDHDLSYRLRLMGHRFLSAPRALVRHREGTEGVSFREKTAYPKKRAFLHSRNRWIALLKNHRWRTLILSAPGLGLMECAWLVFSIREGVVLDYIQGKLSFLCLMPQLMKKRKQVQKKRILKDTELLSALDLTFSPLIRKSGFEAFLERNLNRVLRFWWRIIKPLCG